MSMVYDSFLVLTLMWTTAAIYHTITNNWLMDSKIAPVGYNPLLSSLLFLVTFCFFTFFWTRSGQTLGMQAWRIRVQQVNQQPITLWQALLRFMIAIPSIGLCFAGVLWMLLDKEKKTWNDHYSMTQVVYLKRADTR